MRQFVICCAIIALCSFTIYSQVKYTSSGNLGIGTTNPLSTLSLGGDGYSTYTVEFNSDNASQYGGVHIYHALIDHDPNYGLLCAMGDEEEHIQSIAIQATANRSTAVTNSDTYTIGVAGYAGNGSTGYNYGVMGKLVGQRDGAGILGLDSQHSFYNLWDDYAGFFIGDVKITQELAVQSIYEFSDIRLKKDIRPIGDNNLTKLS